MDKYVEKDGTNYSIEESNEEFIVYSPSKPKPYSRKQISRPPSNKSIREMKEEAQKYSFIDQEHINEVLKQQSKLPITVIPIKNMICNKLNKESHSYTNIHHKELNNNSTNKKNNLSNYFTTIQNNSPYINSHILNNNQSQSHKHFQNNDNQNNIQIGNPIDNDFDFSKTDQLNQKIASNIKDNLNKLKMESKKSQQNITRKYSESKISSPSQIRKTKTVYVKSNENEGRTYETGKHKSANFRSISPIASIPENNLFKPIIDPKSREMAKNIEPIMTRCLHKKNNHSKDKIAKTEASSLIPLTKNSKNNSSFRCLHLYDKALQTREKLEKIRQEVKLEDEDYIKSLTPFKPKLYKTSYYSKFPNEKNNKTQENIDVYTRQQKWKTNVNFKNEKSKNDLFNQDIAFYPFKPDISKKKIFPNEEDKKIIMKNMASNSSYIERRQTSLQKKKSDEEYANKKFGYDVSNYRRLQDVKLQKINVNFNHSESFIQKMKNARQKSPNLGKIRELLGVNAFFEEKETKSTNKQKDLINGINVDDIQENSGAKEFIKALTNLQKNVKDLKL